MSFSPEPDYKEKMSIAYPSQVKYSTLKPQAVMGDSSIRIFQSTNSTQFDPRSTNQARIDITCGMGGFLDSANGYLNIEIQGANSTVGVGGSQKLDGGIWSVVEKLEILSGGKVIESIENYHLLHNKLYQHNTSESSLPHFQATSLTAGSLVPQIIPASADTAALLANANAVLQRSNRIYNSDGFDLLETGTLKGSFNPISGFLNGSKYVPLGSSSQGFTIQLTFASSNSCLKTGDAAHNAGYIVTKCEYVAPIVYIRDPSFLTNWSSMMSLVGGVSYEGRTYRCHTTSLPAGNTTHTININEKCKSLDGFLTIIRQNPRVNLSNANGLTQSSISDGGNNQSYQYKIGESHYPPAEIRYNCNALADIRINTEASGSNTSRPYLELQKMFGNVNNHKKESLIGLTQFQAQEGVTGGMGMFGMDLESYQGDTNTNEKGIDTASNGLISSLELQYDTGAVARRVDTFCVKTALYHLGADGEFNVTK